MCICTWSAGLHCVSFTQHTWWGLRVGRRKHRFCFSSSSLSWSVLCWGKVLVVDLAVLPLLHAGVISCVVRSSCCVTSVLEGKLSCLFFGLFFFFSSSNNYFSEKTDKLILIDHVSTPSWLLCQRPSPTDNAVVVVVSFKVLHGWLHKALKTTFEWMPYLCIIIYSVQI